MTKHHFIPLCYPLFLITIFFAVTSSCHAASRSQIIPSLTIQHQYDDNIYLSESHREKSDQITTVTPSVTYLVNNPVGNFSLLYAPTFVKYYDYDENDTIRHRADLSAGYYLSRHVRFNFSDSFLRSEDVSEEQYFDGSTKIRYRENRQTYYRNNATVSLNYFYARQSNVNIGFFHQYLENNDESLDDGSIYGPTVTIAHWFTSKTGTELTYQYQHGEYTRDDISQPSNDYDGHDANIRFLHMFSPHTTAWIEYGYSLRSFEGPINTPTEEDYTIHSGTIGFDHTFSRHYTLSLSGGAYRQIYDGEADNQSGFMYGASLTRDWRRASLTISGSGGWDEDFLAGDPNRSDFSEYVNGSVGFVFRFTEDITSDANASYRRDDYQTGIDENTITANIGVSYTIFRWLWLSVDYHYITRDSDDPDDEFTDNRIALSLTASRPIDID